MYLINYSINISQTSHRRAMLHGTGTRADIETGRWLFLLLVGALILRGSGVRGEFASVSVGTAGN
jgi:hypothetical protein